jgi:hypothetical protein
LHGTWVLWADGRKNVHVNLPLVRLAVALIVAALITTGVPGRSVPGRAATASVTSGGATHTVWLCRLGQADNPCTANLDTAVAHRDGTITVKHVAPTANSGFDCFYVYPTVSTERQDNADLRVQAAEITAARAQASRFSQVCKVWAVIAKEKPGQSAE